MKRGSEENLKIAVATVNNKGLQDNVSPEFGYARTFTIIEIEDGKIKNIEVIDNPAKNLGHGRGLIVTKSLADKGVNILISGEIGPGASVILEQFGIRRVIVEPGRKVDDVLREENLKI